MDPEPTLDWNGPTFCSSTLRNPADLGMFRHYFVVYFLPTHVIKITGPLCNWSFYYARCYYMSMLIKEAINSQSNWCPQVLTKGPYYYFKF